MLTVVTPASNTQLATLADVKTLLGLTDTSQDAVLTLLIKQASDAIVKHCNRKWAQETYKETVPAYDTNYLMVSRTPVISVSQVSYNSGVLDPLLYEVKDPDAGLIFGTVPYFWTVELASGMALNPMAGSELERYAVDYVAGYNLPGDATQTTPLPGDVEMACQDTVATWYYERPRNPYTILEQVGDLKVQYALPTAIGKLPPRALGLLEDWRRWV